jgi:hypothetical protein
MGEIEARVVALPVALHQHIVEEIETAEQAARAVPFAFGAPLDPAKLDDFHRYLGKIREQLRQAKQTTRQSKR